MVERLLATTKEARSAITSSKAALLLSLRKATVTAHFAAVSQQACLHAMESHSWGGNVLQRSSPSQRLDFSVVTVVAALAQIKSYQAAEA